MLGRPDLAVGMRVARAHHRAAVLEDRRVCHPRHRGQRAVLADPRVDDRADRGAPCGPASDRAAARSRRRGRGPAPTGVQQSIVVHPSLRRRQRRMRVRVVSCPRFKPHLDGNERSRSRCRRRTSMCTAGLRSPRWRGRCRDRDSSRDRTADCIGRRRIDLSLPRPIVAMRRHDHPFATQRIESGVCVMTAETKHSTSALRFRSHETRKRRTTRSALCLCVSVADRLCQCTLVTSSTPPPAAQIQTSGRMPVFA